MPLLASRFLMRFLDPRDREGVLRVVGVDEERHLVAQALHLEEPLTAEHREQVLFLSRQLGWCHGTALRVASSLIG